MRSNLDPFVKISIELLESRKLYENNSIIFNLCFKNISIAIHNPAEEIRSLSTKCFRIIGKSSMEIVREIQVNYPESKF